MIGFRTQKIEAFELIPEEFLQSDELMTYKDKLRFMIEQLVTNPDDTFFWILFNKDKLVGFMFAFIVPIGHYCFVEQAHVKNNTPSSQTKKCVVMLEEFCRQKGCKVIKMNTSRNPIAFGRRWGFEVYSYNMIKKVGE